MFKRAETPQELEQIHRLNFRTFVTEIGQHPDAGSDRLVDKFHHKNAYFIVLCDNQLIGMVSGHSQPPFSVADRLEDPTILTQPGVRPLEVRLLAVEPDRRNSLVFFGLIWSLYEYALAEGYTHLFISGIKQRLPLYKRLGFEALGPAVGVGEASFVPMALTVGQLPRKVERVKRLWETHIERIALSADKLREWGQATLDDEDMEAALPRQGEVCLLPGPVTTSAAVRDAFHRPPIYHRGDEFITLFQRVRATLAGIVHCRDVGLLNGSGTLGNECVAATLAATNNAGRGALLVNGEFGTRLARQARRFGLNPQLLTWPWGQPWDLDEVEAALAAEPPGSWVWGVHQESSTGVLNDLPGLVRLARERDVRVCVDCISSLGAVPIDLDGVFLATGATGKSLGSYAGISIVFADAAELRRINTDRVPSYFDLAAHLSTEGPRFTFPSPLL
ncbi:MAG TPA: aminotransferase class V-fold PLP-dependent enzyme, partial [Gemmataceae bacterium]|nr:aminotransferase class V-fold PLP-dependent enzyme [Gemmataceae bacterium]